MISRPNSAPGAGDVMALQRILSGYRTLNPRVYGQCSPTNPIGGVYLLRDARSDEIVYAGRSSDLVRREWQYSRTPWRDYIFDAPIRTDSYSQQRGLEQLLYERYSPPLNVINPISPHSPRRDFYLEAAQPLAE